MKYPIHKTADTSLSNGCNGKLKIDIEWRYNGEVKPCLYHFRCIKCGYELVTDDEEAKLCVESIMVQQKLNLGKLNGKLNNI